MPVKIGIVGMGYMGKVHFDAYQGIRGARIVALATNNKKRLRACGAIRGNLARTSNKMDLSGIALCNSLDELLECGKVDAVDLNLPTDMHAVAAIKALEAGKHVICEKPMALNARQAARMVSAAKKAQRQLLIAQCLRFWPVYARTREIVQSRKYGKVISARFGRFSSTPVWSSRNWLTDLKRSGGAALDLHIHDSDFILHTFGKPKSVTSHRAGFSKGRIDHILTVYQYSANMLVTAEGGWEYAPGFGFQMWFDIVMEEAMLVCAPDLRLALHPVEGKSRFLRLSPQDAYTLELKHFVQCIARNKTSEIVPPESALATLRLVEAEIKSARTGRPVTVKL